MYDFQALFGTSLADQDFFLVRHGRQQDIPIAGPGQGFGTPVVHGAPLDDDAGFPGQKRGQVVKQATGLYL